MSKRFRNLTRTTKLLSPILALLLCLQGLSSNARAQVLYGSVIGSVTDTAGGSVPGASVRLTNTGTNQTREVTSDENGNFIFTSVPGGTYSVSVKKTGFQTYST